MTKDQAIARAQIDANREHEEMAVFNLNPFGSLWVIRHFDPSMLTRPPHGLVRVVPQ
jgi:hypothetical protein